MLKNIFHRNLKRPIISKKQRSGVKNPADYFSARIKEGKACLQKVCVFVHVDVTDIHDVPRIDPRSVAWR